MGFKLYIREIRLPKSKQSETLIKKSLEDKGSILGSPEIKFMYRYHVTVQYLERQIVEKLIEGRDTFPFSFKKMYNKAVCYKCDDANIQRLFWNCNDHNRKDHNASSRSSSTIISQALASQILQGDGLTNVIGRQMQNPNPEHQEKNREKCPPSVRQVVKEEEKRQKKQKMEKKNTFLTNKKEETSQKGMMIKIKLKNGKDAIIIPCQVCLDDIESISLRQQDVKLKIFSSQLYHGVKKEKNSKVSQDKFIKKKKEPKSNSKFIVKDDEFYKNQEEITNYMTNLKIKDQKEFYEEINEQKVEKETKKQIKQRSSYSPIEKYRKNFKKDEKISKEKVLPEKQNKEISTNNLQDVLEFINNQNSFDFQDSSVDTSFFNKIPLFKNT